MSEIKIPFQGGLWGKHSGRDILAAVFKVYTGIGVFNQGYVAYHIGGWHVCDEPFDSVGEDWEYQLKYDRAGGQGYYLYDRMPRINSIMKNELDITPDNIDQLTLQTSPFSALAFNLTIAKFFKIESSPDGQYPIMRPKY